MPIKYVTDNIIVGNGEVPAVKDPHGVLEWVLPGGLRTRCRDTAQAYAERLNDIISVNLLPFRRKLLRGA